MSALQHRLRADLAKASAAAADLADLLDERAAVAKFDAWQRRRSTVAETDAREARRHTDLVNAYGPFDHRDPSSPLLAALAAHHRRHPSTGRTTP